MNVLTISQLYPSRLRMAIKLRVARLWDCIVPGTGKFLGIAFVGTDCTDNGIQVQIAKEDVQMFKPLLVEGTLYKIIGFRVGAPTASNVATATCYVLFLSKNTVVEPIDEDISPYPRYYFDFTTENHLTYLANRDRFLADAVGILVQVTPIATIYLPGGMVSKKRDLYIMSFYNRLLKVSLWESSYNTLEMDQLIAMQPKPIMVFGGMIVRTNNAAPYLMSCNASKIYVNLEIPEVQVPPVGRPCCGGTWSSTSTPVVEAQEL